MKNKKIIAAGLAAALAVTSLSGCAGNGGQSTAIDSKYDYHTITMPTDEVTLNIAMDQGSSNGLVALAEAFHEEYPNVTVNVYYLNWDDLNAKVANADSTDPVDGFMVSYRQKLWIDTYLETWKTSCEAFNETDIVDLSMFNHDLIDSTTVNGTVYALPLSTGSVGIMCNTDLLKECGIDKVPSTTEELLAACETVKSKGYQPFRCMPRSISYIIEGMTGYEIQKDGKTDQFTAAALTADGMSEYLGSAADFLNKCNAGGYIDTTSVVYNPEANDYAGADEEITSYKQECYAFLNGDVAFFPAYPAVLSSVQKREERLQAYIDNPFNYSMIPVPTKYGASPERTMSYSLLVCKNSANYEWINQFARFVFYRENRGEVGNVAIFNDAQFMMSPFDSDTVHTEIGAKYYSEYYKLFAGDNSCSGDFTKLLAYNGYGVFRGCIFSKMGDILDASDSVDGIKQAIDNAAKTWFIDGEFFTS